MNAVLEAIGEDLILSMIESGHSQTEVSAEVGVSQAELSRWLRADPERTSRVRDAKLQSAEAWLDRGFTALITVDSKARSASNDIALAREIAQHCRKVAAIRNPREYGDKIDISGQIDHKLGISALFKSIVSTPSLVGCIVPDDPEDAVLIVDKLSTDHNM